MNISEFCIRRPIFTTLLMVSLIILGIIGYRSMAVSALPRVDMPTLSISAQISGASPEFMAQNVAGPLERQLTALPAVDNITSVNYLGRTQITVQFNLDRNIDGAATDVQSAMIAAQPYMPKEMVYPPTYRKVNPADQPVLIISVSSDTLRAFEVNNYAESFLAQKISSLNGVGQVLIYGSQKYALRVRVNPKLAAARNLSLNEIGAAAAAALNLTPGGWITGPRQSFSLGFPGQPKDAKTLEPVIINWSKNAPVRFRDIAKIEDDVEDEYSAAFYEGKPAIILAVLRQPDANVVHVVDSIKKLLPSFREQLPKSLDITIAQDRSASIRAAIADVELTLIIAILLVVGVIYFFLKSAVVTLVPALAVPLSIIATYAGMSFCGFSHNSISLLALALSVGFVVDDAIVMLENIIRHKEAGKTTLDATILGSKEITFTILSITFSLVAVFIPVLFMQGIVGKLLHEFAVTISMAILISGFISLTITPMMCQFALKNRINHKSSGSNILTRGFERGYTYVLQWYGKTLKTLLNYPKLVLGGGLASLAVTCLLFAFTPKGFLPIEDIGFVTVFTQADQDISFEAMIEKQKQVSDIIRSDPAVDSIFHATGGQRGAVNSGRLFFGLKPHKERDDVATIIKRLHQKVTAVEGLDVFFNPAQNLAVGGRTTKALYQHTLQGTDLKELQTWSTKVEDKLRQINGVTDLSSDLMLNSLQVLVDLDQDKAHSLGITYQNLRSTLYKAYGNPSVGFIYTSANNYAVIIELDEAFQQSIEDLESLPIKSSTGQTVELRNIAKLRKIASPLVVNHTGAFPSVTHSFNVTPGVSLSEVVANIKQIEHDVGLPASIVTSFQGTAQEFVKSLSSATILVIMACVVMYLILGMLFESFIHPITIISGLPSAAIGAIVTLLLFGHDLDLIGILGIVLLIGIVKKNAIMIVDFALGAISNGSSPREAVIEACLMRFRPIMMTTCAAIFGAIPAAFSSGIGSEWRQPLGLSVIGGLLVSQMITLYLTPVLFLKLQGVNTRIQRWIGSIK